jgi:hypothetical protein
MSTPVATRWFTRPNLVGLLVLGAMVGWVIYDEVMASRRKHRLAALGSLSAFITSGEQSAHLSVIDGYPPVHFVWVGKRHLSATLDSGSPAFFFDETGRLVDWVSLTGEGGPRENLVRAARDRRDLTTDEALGLIQPEIREPPPH